MIAVQRRFAPTSRAGYVSTTCTGIVRVSSRTSSLARFRVVVALSAVLLGTSGYSSCAGTTGPLFAPLILTPTEVLLRSSIGNRQEAVALARVEGGDAGNSYQSAIEYGRDGSGWLTVEISGRDLVLRARPDGLDPGLVTATVRVEEVSSGQAGSLRVEFQVTR